MTTAREVWGKFRTGLHRKLSVQPSIGEMINIGISIACIIAISIAPKMGQKSVTPDRMNEVLKSVDLDTEMSTAIYDAIKQEIETTSLSWGNFTAWWTALTSSVAVLFAALYLKYSEKAKYTVTRRTVENRLWISRQMNNARIIHELIRPGSLEEAKKIHSEIEICRRDILENIQSDVCQTLGCTQRDSIEVTIMDFSGPLFDKTREDEEKIFASSRTAKAYLTGDSFDREESISFHSISEGRPIVIQDVKNDPKWCGTRKKTPISIRIR